MKWFSDFSDFLIRIYSILVDFMYLRYLETGTDALDQVMQVS